VTLNVDTATIQARVTGGCVDNQHVSAIAAAGAITCATNSADISEVIAGTGLLGGGATGAVTLSVDTATIQSRVTGACAAGSSIRIIDAGGLVTCEIDDVGVGGAGTIGKIAKFTGAAAIGDSVLTEDADGDIGIGTATPSEQLELTKNLRLTPTTATAGIIKSGANTLIHTFGAGNFFAGVNAGNLAMTGGNNTATGQNALRSNTNGFNNTAMGLDALFSNTTGGGNTATGQAALRSNTTGGDNTAMGVLALQVNTTGSFNAAMGSAGLFANTTGRFNTAMGNNALSFNTTGSNNTAVGDGANVSVGDLTNATAIGANATVNASNKIRLGNTLVTVIQGQVGFTSVSDAHQKENFLPVDGEATLDKLRQFTVGSWNLKGQDPTQFRHYGPTAQEFFAAFGQDDLGTIGSETTITSTDIEGIMLLAIQALERRTAALQEELARVQAEKEAGVGVP
jgi:uncharacterized small protein (DUF1192 family)